MWLEIKYELGSWNSIINSRTAIYTKISAEPLDTSQLEVCALRAEAVWSKALQSREKTKTVIFQASWPE